MLAVARGGPLRRTWTWVVTWPLAVLGVLVTLHVVNLVVVFSAAITAVGVGEADADAVVPSWVDTTLVVSAIATMVFGLLGLAVMIGALINGYRHKIAVVVLGVLVALPVAFSALVWLMKLLGIEALASD